MRKFLLPVCLAAVLLVGCCPSVVRQGAVVRHVISLPATFAFTSDQPSDDEQGQLVTRNCLYGAPALASTQHPNVARVYRDRYVLMHESEAKVPLYVCEHVSPEDAPAPLW